MNIFQEPEHVSMLRNTLRQFIDKEMPREKVNQWDKDDYFPRDVFDKLCEFDSNLMHDINEFNICNIL